MRRLLLPIALLALLCGSASLAAATPVTIDTEITAGPAEGSTTADETPTFSFAATADGLPLAAAGFWCSVDEAPAVACASPYRLAPLEEEGPHSFSVYAEDALGDRDPEPATRTFFVEFEEDGEEESECEEPGEELEDEEGNVEICDAEGGTSSGPPPECMLRSARARLFVYAAHDKVRLVVRYTSFAPADVLVGFHLGGSQTAPKIGRSHAHFAKKGVFRLTEKLSAAQMTRVRAAKRFTVTLDIPAAPSFCERFSTRHLTIRRTVHGQAVWFESDSGVGAG